MPTQRQMKLGAVFIHTGNHKGGWRDKRGQADAGVNFPHYVRMAQTAEQAKLDFIFLPDHSGIHYSDNLDKLRWTGQLLGGFEPITLLSALAATTSNVGLIATASTSFDQPYNVARKFASLDLISGGRAGWNLVTSHNDIEAQNFNADKHLSHDSRYDRAAEFADVALGLWDSWDDDAFLRDTETSLYFDPAKLHILNHHGKHFQVRGPLNVPRSPQGRPVIAQAGSSDIGRDMAAKYGEVVFTGQNDLAEAQEFYRDIKHRAAAFGRNPDDVLILPGLMTITGKTEEEAQARNAMLRSNIHPEFAVMNLSHWIGIDTSSLPLDEELPDIPETNAHKSRQAMLMRIARRDRLTVRQLALQVAENTGHGKVVGSPEQVADHIEKWFTEGAADGFNLLTAADPADLNDFTSMVVPILQERGLFRTEYESNTLRGNLGLPLAPSRYAHNQLSAAE